MNTNTKKFNKEYKQKKLKILERDNWKCMHPNNKNHFGTLDVDHIIPRSRKKDNSDENLITLCRYHHVILTDTPTDEKIGFLQKIMTDKYGYDYGVHNNR